MTDGAESEVQDEQETNIEQIIEDEATIDIDDLPVRGEPDQFLIAVSYLKEGGARKVGDLDDEIEEYGSTNLSGNLKLGEILGFIDRTTEGVALTDSGYELAFAAEESEDLTDLFRENLRNARPYLQLLRGTATEYDEDFDSIVKNSDILQVMRTKFGMREVDENKLKRSISILFEVLEEGGYGERKQSSGDYPTRFSFSEEWTLRSMIGDLSQNTESQDEVDSVSQEDQKEQERDEQEKKEPEDADSPQKETSVDRSEDNAQTSEGDDPDDSESVEIQDGEDVIKQRDQMSETHNIDISVHIEIDVNSMDTAEFEKKMEHLSNLLQYTNQEL